MPFSVPQAAMLNGLEPGTTIEFTYVVDKDASHAENIRVRGFESLEQKPLELRRLKLLNGLASPESRAGCAGGGPAGAGVRPDRPEPAAGRTLQPGRQGRRRDVHLHPLPEPGVLLPAGEQLLAAAEAIPGSSRPRPGLSDHRHRSRTRPEGRARRLRAHLDGRSRRSGTSSPARCPRSSASRTCSASTSGATRDRSSIPSTPPSSIARASWPPTWKEISSRRSSWGTW